MLDSAAAMDAIYRRQRFIYDLTRRPYLFGRDQMVAELEPPPGGSVSRSDAEPPAIFSAPRGFIRTPNFSVSMYRSRC